MRIDRMLGITVLLLGRDRVTARELSERFEVSIRTIYRDLEAVLQAGIPVVCLPGRGGGYSLMDNYKVDHRLLNFQDIIAILMALRGVNSAVQSPDIEAAIDKIRSLIPREKAPEAEQHLEQLVMDYLPWGAGRKLRDRLKGVHRAITGNHLLRLVYRNRRGETITRVVEPMTLLFKGYSWYLHAYCRTREDYRLFKLTRMVSADELPEAFVRRHDAPPYVDDSGEPDVPPIHLVVRISPQARLRAEDYFDADAMTSLEDGHLLATADWPEDEWVYETILSFGEHAVVLEPPHVRQRVRDSLRKTLAAYET